MAYALPRTKACLVGLSASPAVPCEPYGADSLSCSEMCAPDAGVKVFAPSSTSFFAAVKTLRGRGVVILDQSDYASKIKSILDDR